MSESYRSSLVAKILDILTPIASSGVEKMALSNILAKVRSIPTGIKIERDGIMDLISPSSFPLVKKIEGDYVYFTKMSSSDYEASADVKKHDSEKVRKAAEKTAKKAMKMAKDAN